MEIYKLADKQDSAKWPEFDNWQPVSSNTSDLFISTTNFPRVSGSVGSMQRNTHVCKISSSIYKKIRKYTGTICLTTNF